MFPLSSNGGLGHRFTEVVLGMKFAQENNVTYLYNKDTWSPVGIHGGYEWMIDFLPLHAIEVTRNDHYHRQQQQQGLQVIQGQWEWMVQHYSKENSCNIEMRTKLNMCCKDRWSNETCWCTFDEGRMGSFDTFKGRLREAFSKSKYFTPKHLSLRLQDLGVDKSINVTTITNKTSYSLIVWHLRVGDIVLNARHEYFSNIATQLSFSFQNSTMIPLIIFLGEGGKEGMKSFPYLPSLCHDFFLNNCFYPNMDVKDSLYHMIHSDILITSGSSFSAMAGVLRSNGMTLAARPKEGKAARPTEGVVGIYETSEQLLIDKDGKIAKIGALKVYIEQKRVSNYTNN